MKEWDARTPGARVHPPDPPHRSATAPVATGSADAVYAAGFDGIGRHERQGQGLRSSLGQTRVGNDQEHWTQLVGPDFKPTTPDSAAARWRRELFKGPSAPARGTVVWRR